jgi:glycosyltransferase involved in cell wall biosynthesis
MCTSIVAPSTKIERHLREWGVTVPIDVIATGVDINRFGARDEARALLMRDASSATTSDRVMLYVGRLGREKNVELLIGALWHSRRSDTRLVIAGDGPSRSSLEALAQELGLENRISFVGYLEREDIVVAYHAADAFVFGSTSETQGLVIGEAMAAGLPVIAAHDHAVADFVISGRTGLMVPGRPEDVAAAIDALAGDEDLRLRMGAAAKERARHFSVDHQAERLEHHYTQAIETYSPKRMLSRLQLPRRRSETESV